MRTRHSTSEPQCVSSRPVGLILSGGGARTAYQAGVLAGVLEVLDPGRSPDFCNPFSIISGTSAGAINAAAYACHAHQPHDAVEGILRMWSSLHTGMVYHADAWRLLRTGLRWFGMLAAGWIAPSLRSHSPRSLLDNEPLGELLERVLNFDQLNRNLQNEVIDALAITASGYSTGEHITFFQARGGIKPWRRSLRKAVPTTIGVDHLLASSAIPFVFPAKAMLVHGHTEWCGDGSMRHLAPISPAIHLGAEKIFVVGTGYRDETHPERRHADPKYPSLAQVGGHVLFSIFQDTIASDFESMGRINNLLAQLEPNVLKSQSLRPISTLAITPSRSLDELAMVHLTQMPRAARTLFSVLGVSSKSGSGAGAALISYLLFEGSYTQALIELGRADSFRRAEEVHAFFKETPG
ncbi:MAG TPA: patatin-like phospholipase family protein [Burkholderiaceae bacterium]|nr:patatin-like phospholipase family protein [Burkholderiaceae bacterium]